MLKVLAKQAAAAGSSNSESTMATGTQAACIGTTCLVAESITFYTRLQTVAVACGLAF